MADWPVRRPQQPVAGRRGWIVLVGDTLGVGAAVALELCLDQSTASRLRLVPWRRSPNCVSPFDGGLVAPEFELRHHQRHGIRGVDDGWRGRQHHALRARR